VFSYPVDHPTDPLTPVAVACAPAWCGSAVPAYALDLVHGVAIRHMPVTWSGHGQLMSGPAFSLISLTVHDCLALAPDDFERAVEQLYRELGRLLVAERRYPIRVWNFIPAINDPLGPGFDRYMAFNAGRYGGYASWSPTGLADWVPAASAVGTLDTTLSVHCLGADAPGVPLENAGQIPAYRYSRRYGPRPPCFARATVLSTSRAHLLFVSGTASIRGQESVHIGSLADQLEVTFENLHHMWNAARESQPAVPTLTDARVYLPQQSDAEFVMSRLGAALPTVARVECVPSALCRPELLVEIEVAAIPATVRPPLSAPAI
jgi:chorismate lyase/3-hydroxybenzoate synthase